MHTSWLLLVLAAVSAAHATNTINSDTNNDGANIPLSHVNDQPLLLQYAGDHLKNNRSFVLTMVETNGLNLQFASDELKGDREVVLAAATQNASALQFAAEELRGDPDFMLKVNEASEPLIKPKTFKTKDEARDFVYDKMGLARAFGIGAAFGGVGGGLGGWAVAGPPGAKLGFGVGFVLGGAGNTLYQHKNPDANHTLTRIACITVVGAGAGAGVAYLGITFNNDDGWIGVAAQTLQEDTIPYMKNLWRSARFKAAVSLMGKTGTAGQVLELTYNAVDGFLSATPTAHAAPAA
mmetsp:Transcript_34473/g.80588  ORF Transcript_34473/g.80588 Transcript_34473/m.80588 type:complete len:294 (-) Transcript_34473:101-982(-)